MPRSMWKGAIQFGLVTIPIRLYLATDSKGISFNMLHETDKSRIQMKIWCPEDETVISRSETVRGYEWAPDKYVVITDEDLEKVPLKTVRAIEIEQFVAADGGAAPDGPVRFAKQSYYVEPEKIGQKAFYLLRSVLEEKGLTAICKVVIRDREALAKLDPYSGTMLLTTLHWPDEIRAIDELDLPDASKMDFKPAERKMAEQLIDAMTGEFDAAQYHDEYRDALMEVIEAKVEGHEVVAAPAEPGEKLIDLMAALQASVDAARASRAEKPTSVAEARKARAAGVAARSVAGAEAEPGARTAAEPGAGTAAERKPTRARAAAEGSTAKAKSAGSAARSGRAASDAGETDEAEAQPARRRKTA